MSGEETLFLQNLNARAGDEPAISDLQPTSCIRPVGVRLCSYSVDDATQRALPAPWVSGRHGSAP